MPRSPPLGSARGKLSFLSAEPLPPGAQEEAGHTVVSGSRTEMATPKQSIKSKWSEVRLCSGVISTSQGA